MDYYKERNELLKEFLKSRYGFEIKLKYVREDGIDSFQVGFIIKSSKPYLEYDRINKFELTLFIYTKTKKSGGKK